MTPTHRCTKTRISCWCIVRSVLLHLANTNACVIWRSVKIDTPKTAKQYKYTRLLWIVILLNRILPYRNKKTLRWFNWQNAMNTSTHCDVSVCSSHSFHENIAFFFYPIRRFCRADFFKICQNIQNSLNWAIYEFLASIEVMI